MNNAEIAGALEELADLYELDGAVPHRVLTYRRAARAISEATISVAQLAAAGRATELPGIGEVLQEKIQALLATGSIPAAAALRVKFPPGVLEMTRVPGLGPNRARRLYEELQIDSLAALREAAERNQLRKLRGLGAKFEANVIAAIDQNRQGRRSDRVLMPRALDLAEQLVRALGDRGPADVVVRCAGSVRRLTETAGNVNLIACTEEPLRLQETVAALDLIERAESAGDLALKAMTHAGIAVDLRISRHAEYGCLLQQATGSRAHNAALSEHAEGRGLVLGEAAIGEPGDGGRHPCRNEPELYDRLGLAYIEPELREDRGEIVAAARGAAALPELIALQHIRGDLHCHTQASDGRASIEEMAYAALERGYQYLAITDHSASHGFGDAVSAEQLKAQIERIRDLNATITGIEILAGSEVNILPDGSLDYDDELLGELDWVIASVHTAFAMDQQRMTERMLRAVRHPMVDAIAHPTGRLIEQREPYAIDLSALISEASATGTMLEINANPLRRDLDEIHARAAAQAGVKLVINSDAHSTADLALMRWGIATARRAWLRSADVANTRTLAEIRHLRKAARRSKNS